MEPGSFHILMNWQTTISFIIGLFAGAFLLFIYIVYGTDIFKD